MRIAVIGSGYVGLVTSACLANLGNRVICVDNNAKKIAELKKGKIPLYEPGLDKLVLENAKRKRIKFDTSIKQAVRNCEIIFIAVGTPSMDNGEADLTCIENVARNVAVNMDGYRLIVEKSTVPVETGEWVKHTIAIHIKRKIEFDVASNPEFLREGSAVKDFMHPDRIVIGVESKRAERLLTELYRPLKAPMVITDIKSAELIKHASNSFLANKISFINAISRICDKVGADVIEVAKGMGLDKRIGPDFLNAGLGYGGSCFPKDLDAFVHISDKLGYDFRLLKAVRDINRDQKEFVFGKLKDALWILKEKNITVLGLSFKPDTDDLRNSPAIDLINMLKGEGAKIRIFDPKAMVKAKDILRGVVFCRNPYDASKQSDCLLVTTEWQEFRTLDFKKLKRLMRRPLIADTRNIYEPKNMERLGFQYIGIGRPVSSVGKQK